jgi:hypothetical protein
MPEEAQTTVDEPVNNTGADSTDTGASSGAATQTAQTEATQTDIANTPEFKLALSEAISKKIPQLKRQIARDFAGEPKDGQPNVDELQRQLNDTRGKLRSYESRDTIQEFIANPKNALNIPSHATGAFTELVLPLLTYDEDGRPENLEEVALKVLARHSDLFVAKPSSFNGNNGRNAAPVPVNMNDRIRQLAGIG